jgi:hypothetical protein
MGAVTHASAGHDGATFTAWLKGFGRALRGERAIVSTHEAAQAMSRAAAEKKRRAELTHEERKADLHARMCAERDGGWPVPPAQINRELAR